MNKPRHKYSPEDEGIIRRDYSGSKKSAEAIAMKIGVTYTAIQSKAQSMAICKYRPLKKWTQKDKDNLKELIGKYPPHKVAKIMGRPLPSIMNMVYKSGIRTRCFRDGWYTKEDACIIFGVNHRRVQYYIDNGMLKATHHNGHKDGYHTVWHISKKDMKIFICRYPEELNGRNVDLGQIFDILGVLDPYKYNLIGQKEKVNDSI